jgi:hypothetical protein
MPKANLIHMDPIYEDILLDEAAGGAATEVMLVVPSVVEVNEAFEIGVSFLDKNGQGCSKGTPELTLKKGAMLKKELTVQFAKGSIAAARVPGAKVSKAGTFRLEGRWKGKAVFSNPVRCVAKATRRIRWGDPHIHTTIGDCVVHLCRTPDCAAIAAQHVYFLDWVTLADHVSNNRGSRGRWMTLRATDRRYNDPGRFVMLPGYEASLSGGSGGDNNVYFVGDLDIFVDHHGKGNSKTLSKELDPLSHIVVPHHTTRTGKHGEIPKDIYPGPDKMPVVEIHSKWGSSEFRGNTQPLQDHLLHDGPSTVQDLLAQGYHLGFVGGTDAHCSLTWGRVPGFESDHIDRLPGITAVSTPSLTQKGIFSNIRSRNCYAACGQRTLLDVTVGGKGMGKEVILTKSKLPKTRKIVIDCAAKEDIATIEIIRNGKIIHTEKPKCWRSEFTFIDDAPLTDVAMKSTKPKTNFVYYYVRLATKTDAKAWSSPVKYTWK